MNFRSLIMLPILLSGASFMLNAAPEGKSSFAVASDLHLDLSVEKSALLKDFVETVNSDPEIGLVVFLGDLTSCGSDKELKEASEILSALQKECYVLPGNNDLSWSESGGETFFRLFGRQPFDFEYCGIRFMGSRSIPLSENSGVCSFSEVKRAETELPESGLPVIYFKHDPLYDSFHRNEENRTPSMKMLEALKSGNVQLIVSGEGPESDIMDIDGIPNLTVSSLDNGGVEESRFSRVTIDGSILKFANVGLSSGKTENWFYIRMSNGKSFTEEASVRQEPYSMLESASMKTSWILDLGTDMSAASTPAMPNGLERNGVKQVCADVDGNVYAIGGKSGAVVWKKELGSPVFGSVAVAGDRVVLGSADGRIRCLSLAKGSQLWQYQCDEAVLSQPAVSAGKVYVGSSDSRFRCLDLNTGRLLWTFSDVRGAVLHKAYADKSLVVFADVMNNMYCLSATTGRLQWTWTNHKNGRLPDYDEKSIADRFSGNVQDFHPQHLSVYSDIHRCGDKFFMSSPEDKLLALRENTGFQVWYSRGATSQILMNTDEKEIYCLAPEGRLYAMNAQSEKPVCSWSVELGEPIYATDMCINGKYVFISTADGFIIAFDVVQRKFSWKYKVTDYAVKGVSPAGKNAICVSTADGVVASFTYPA